MIIFSNILITEYRRKINLKELHRILIWPLLKKKWKPMKEHSYFKVLEAGVKL